MGEQPQQPEAPDSAVPSSERGRRIPEGEGPLRAPLEHQRQQRPLRRPRPGAPPDLGQPGAAGQLRRGGPARADRGHPPELRGGGAGTERGVRVGVLQDGGLRAGEPAGGKILHLPRAAAERNRECLPAVRRGGVGAAGARSSSSSVPTSSSADDQRHSEEEARERSGRQRIRARRVIMYTVLLRQ